MKIGVVGLGRVGSVVAADLVRAGNSVVGADRDAKILERFSRGLASYREEGVSELIATGHFEGRTTVVPHVREIDAEAIFVCVSTTGGLDEKLDMSDIATAAREIGHAVRNRGQRQSPVQIVICSTLIPGTMREMVLPELIRSVGVPPGLDYEISYWPEFGREGSALSDRSSPSRFVIGERVPGTAILLRQWLANRPAPVFYTSFEVAELVKRILWPSGSVWRTSRAAGLAHHSTFSSIFSMSSSERPK